MQELKRDLNQLAAAAGLTPAMRDELEQCVRRLRGPHREGSAPSLANAQPGASLGAEASWLRALDPYLEPFVKTYDLDASAFRGELARLVQRSQVELLSSPSSDVVPSISAPVMWVDRQMSLPGETLMPEGVGMVSPDGTIMPERGTAAGTLMPDHTVVPEAAGTLMPEPVAPPDASSALGQLPDVGSLQHERPPARAEADPAVWSGEHAAPELDETWLPDDTDHDADLPDEPTRSMPAAPTTSHASIQAPEVFHQEQAGDTLTHRFDDIGLIGLGGMGEVRRVRDRELNRVVALKAIRPELMWNDRVVSRFVAEAQATAQLQHPCIVPVHEMGRLPDGRLYFTMREVKGRQLGELIEALHAVRVSGRWGITTTGLSFRKLMLIFLKTCEAVAYAHSRGVIHRDLKPENIMVGSFGEVLVVDWGLARVLDQLNPDLEERVVTARTTDTSKATMVGRVAGTPGYMPIEQAAGDRSKQGPHSDVYALGAILYEILSGRPPYQGSTAESILKKVLRGSPDPVRESAEVPVVLRQICMRAMQRKIEDRYPTAREMTDALDAWLAGARRREQALVLLSQAQEKARDIKRLRARAGAVRREARRILDSLPPTAPVQDKLRGWEREGMAERLEHGAEVLEAVVAQKAHAALAQSPDLPEAHSFLADHYLDLHTTAEARDDKAGAEKHRVMLKAHDDGRHAAYLAGDGSLTLLTDPPGATVEVFKVVERHRRLERQEHRSGLCTPIVDFELPMGSYLLVISHSDRMTVRYPVWIGRGDAWDGVPPGESAALPIRLPFPQEIGANEQYVPAGWVWTGGDGAAPNSMSRERVWVDSFAMRRHPVSNGEYLEFINDLLRQWREDEAVRYAPSTRGGFSAGTLLYERDKHGNFLLHKGFEANAPVVMVDWHGATAYASWLTIGQGQIFRLAHELEWEKAARGVDGRAYPWGGFLDPTWCAMRQSHSGSRPASLRAFPFDESIYRIQGLAGNVADWCRNPYEGHEHSIVGQRLKVRAEPPGALRAYRALRGGSFEGTIDDCRAGARAGRMADDRSYGVGFRLVRSLG